MNTTGELFKNFSILFGHHFKKILPFCILYRDRLQAAFPNTKNGRKSFHYYSEKTSTVGHHESYLGTTKQIISPHNA
jgi:hypothetical protein